MASKGIFALASLVLVAGGVLFMFFILLAGAVDGFPVNRWYFLEADTGNIPGAPQVSRWTYWNVCGVDGARTACGDQSYSNVRPAFPLNPPGNRNFDTEVNIPNNFLNTDYYYLMTRFMFAFMLIALFFGVCALFTGLLALCTRLGAYLSGLLTMIAAFFQAIQVALMTTAHVKGRNNFRNNGQSARIGSYAFGFEWAAFVCFFLSIILFFLSGTARKEKSYGSKSSGGRFKFRGKRSKSTRSRGSFIGGDKEYS